MPPVNVVGYSRLSKGLSAILVIGFLIAELYPPIVKYVALLPGKTIPFAWNIITAGYLEQSLFGLVLSIYGLLLGGRLLEPMWGSREFTKFIIFVNLFTLFGVYVTAIVLYYTTMRETYLYTPLSGFHGILSGFLVGVKQAMPDQEISFFGRPLLRAEWLPSLLVLITVAISFFIEAAMLYVPFVIYGTYGGWFYLRYLQRNPETHLVGDPHEEFAFSTFFPGFLRPAVEAVASKFHNMFCGARSIPQRDDLADDGLIDPGLESKDAPRRRERGARVLDERLAGKESNLHTTDGHGAENV